MLTKHKQCTIITVDCINSTKHCVSLISDDSPDGPNMSKQ